MPNLTDAQREAVAEADAHLNNVDLPSYTELASLVLLLRAGAEATVANLSKVAIHPKHYKPLADVLSTANELIGGE